MIYLDHDVKLVPEADLGWKKIPSIKPYILKMPCRQSYIKYIKIFLDCAVYGL